MKFNLDKTDYILYPESIYKSKVRFTLFAGVYWVWCLFWLGVALYNIVVNHNYVDGLISGVIHILCLF
ncbi:MULTISPECIES: hypothetical protein [Enterobacteriaceae]|uniref:hypothetical protein n=1 Tax=Enterobacteriaceae TaxID=543 RepID=UPI002E2E1B51|nr:hypothetical protein [Klebsiella pneumoniae]MED6004917.1 hypothetical protein [Klebsiella pneumoniae]MED6058269.1 hypothetical protein [Klebsiella pneumoniae]